MPYDSAPPASGRAPLCLPTAHVRRMRRRAHRSAHAIQATYRVHPACAGATRGTAAAACPDYGVRTAQNRVLRMHAPLGAASPHTHTQHTTYNQRRDAAVSGGRPRSSHNHTRASGADRIRAASTGHARPRHKRPPPPPVTRARARARRGGTPGSRDRHVDELALVGRVERLGRHGRHREVVLLVDLADGRGVRAPG